MTKDTFKVEGMTCEHCAKHVTEALESVVGVKSAKVSLKKKEATIKYEAPAEFSNLEAAVVGAGYKLAQ